MAAPPIVERHLPHFHRRAPMKEACRAATTANITIATALNNGDTLDGVTLATGDRVLVKDQSTASQNGIYEVGASPARAYDESTDDPSFGYLVFVRQGTANAATLWINTNTSTPTIGSTSLTFSQFSASDASLIAAVFGYQAHGNTGSTETFDASVAGWHSATLDANCTFTFTGATVGDVAAMVLELTQDGTGSRLVTWPGSVAWPGGTAPTLSTAGGSTDILSFFSRDGGTTWFGFLDGGGGASTFATPSIVLGSSAAAGAASTVIRSDSTIAAFDATVPVTQALGDTAATGSAAFAARRDHKHGMPAASDVASHGFVGAILISDTPSTPLIFADLLQNEAQTDLVYADPT